MEHRSLGALVELVTSQLSQSAQPASSQPVQGAPNGAATIAPPTERPQGSTDGHADPDPTVIKALELLQVGTLQAAEVRRIIDVLASSGARARPNGLGEKAGR